MAGEFAAKKGELDAKSKDIDAKRVEALAEDRGVEGTGREGRGPVYRQRMSELNLMQGAYKIAEERMKDAQKRLTAVETRMAAIDRELANIDGDLAKLKGEAETAEQRIKLAQDTAKDDTGPKLDPTRLLPAFERGIGDFRQDPTPERLAKVQAMCGDISNALNATPETKSQLKGLDCDPKAVADASASLFTLETGTKVFESSCLGGDKLNANNSADALFGFARRCLADSGLPSKDTDALRTKINGIELARDDKAHRFVVTWNAFKDGNRLAYLALAIATAIDLLVFMSGLFGANAVRSPLSDVPTYKSRSASQLEATINAALGPHAYETAWLTLNALKPMTYSDGFTAIADLSVLDKTTADRVRMVLTAGADIGAVETQSVNPERYRVRSELREYLSTVCDKHIRTDATVKERANLSKIIGAALEPFPREHADLVLHTLEPIRETDGFTSTVTLSEITDAYDSRVVRRVLNAGATQGAVAPDTKVADRYCLRPNIYETLLNIRATSPESANYEFERRRFLGIQSGPAIDGGALREQRAELGQQRRPAELERPQQALPRQIPLTFAEQEELAQYYRDQLLSTLGLNGVLVDKRLASPGAEHAMLEAWKALDAHGKKNMLLGSLLRGFQIEQDRILGKVYSNLVQEVNGDERKRAVLDAVDAKIRDDVVYYMLFPETHLIAHLIEEIERAAQSDDGLQSGEQQLKDQLTYVREGLGKLNLANASSWEEIRQRLSMKLKGDYPGFLNKPNPRKNGNDELGGA